MDVFTLENEYLIINFTNLGGTIIDLIKKSNQLNYVLRYEDINEYKKNFYFLGALIGRNAGRTYPPYYINYLNKKIKLDTNESNKHLHGGEQGLHTKRFEVIKKNKSEYRLFLKDSTSLYDSADIEIIYRLENNKFIYIIRGLSTVPTVFNLTNHTYFNLNSDKNECVEKHLLKINSKEIQLIDGNYIPNGKYEKLNQNQNQEYFFYETKPIERALSLGTSLSNICNGGIDLAYLFDKENNLLNEKIHLKSSDEENQLRIYSNQNTCVVYTLNKINDIVRINDGREIKKYNGITFEMQEMPNYVHILPNCLKKNYESITVYEVI